MSSTQLAWLIWGSHSKFVLLYTKVEWEALISFQKNWFFLQVKSRFAINKRKMEEKKKEYDFDQRMAELKEEEERQKEFKKQKKVRE